MLLSVSSIPTTSVHHINGTLRLLACEQSKKVLWVVDITGHYLNQPPSLNMEKGPNCLYPLFSTILIMLPGSKPKSLWCWSGTSPCTNRVPQCQSFWKRKIKPAWDPAHPVQKRVLTNRRIDWESVWHIRRQTDREMIVSYSVGMCWCIPSHPVMSDRLAAHKSPERHRAITKERVLSPLSFSSASLPSTVQPHPTDMLKDLLHTE